MPPVSRIDEDLSYSIGGRRRPGRGKGEKRPSKGGTEKMNLIPSALTNSFVFSIVSRRHASS